MVFLNDKEEQEQEQHKQEQPQRPDTNEVQRVVLLMVLIASIVMFNQLTPDGFVQGVKDWLLHHLSPTTYIKLLIGLYA